MEVCKTKQWSELPTEVIKTYVIICPLNPLIAFEACKKLALDS
jgi:hypothetical protein